MVIKIPQEKYPIKPVREAFQREGFRYSKKKVVSLERLRMKIESF